MALPTHYTESSLASFMRDVLKNMTKDLGWQDEGFSESINDILIAYGGGVTELSSCTDIPRLRALARVAAWKAVEEATVGDYDTSSSQDADKRSQVHVQAKAQRVAAETALQKLLDDRSGEAEAQAEAHRRAMSASSTVPIVNVW